MNPRSYLFIAFIFLIVIDQSDGKTKETILPCGNSTCVSPQGICFKEKCLCDRFFSGERCDIPWKDMDPIYLGGYLGASIFGCSCNILLIVIGALSVRISILNRFADGRSWKDWRITRDLPLFISLLMILGAIMRFLYMAIDPQNYGENYEFIGGLIFFNIPQIIWSNSFVLMVLLWLQVVESTKRMKSIGFYIGKLFKKFFFLFFFINLIFGFSLVLIDAYVKLIPGQLLYNYYLIILMLFLSCFQLIGGSVYIRKLKEIMKNSKDASVEVENQAKKVHICFICMSLPMYILILNVIIMNTFFDFSKQPFLYIIYRIISDLCPTFAILFAFWAIHKKSKQQTSPNGSTDSNSSGKDIIPKGKQFFNFFSLTFCCVKPEPTEVNKETNQETITTNQEIQLSDVDLYQEV